MKKRLHWLLPLVFTLWAVLSLGLLFANGRQLTTAAFYILSCFFTLSLPFLPIVKPLGLASGVDAYPGLTPMGFAVVLAVYNALLYTLGRLLQKYCLKTG